jgi:hypothetical protein
MGTALGALGGAGLAYLNGRSMSNGAIQGAGYGALGGFLFNEFERANPYGGDDHNGFNNSNTMSTNEDIFMHTSNSAIRSNSSLYDDHGDLDDFDTFMNPLFPSSINGANDRFTTFVNISSHHSGNFQQEALQEMLMAHMDMLRNMGVTLQGNMAHQRGLPEQRIDALPTYKFTTSNMKKDCQSDSKSISSGDSTGVNSSCNCGICLDDYRDGDMVKALPCLHQYHCSCIDKWLKVASTCPICKQSIP